MEIMVGSFKEVFANQEARLQDKVAETDAKKAEASNELASRKANAESAAAELQEKVDELKARQFALAEAVGVTRDAEKALKDTQFEVGILEETKSDLAQEQEAAQATMENFNAFKDGNQDEQSLLKNPC